MKTGYPYLGDFKKQIEINSEQEWNEILEYEPEVKKLIEEYDRNFGLSIKRVDDDHDERI